MPAIAGFYPGSSAAAADNLAHGSPRERDRTSDRAAVAVAAAARGRRDARLTRRRVGLRGRRRGNRRNASVRLRRGRGRMRLADPWAGGVRERRPRQRGHAADDRRPRRRTRRERGMRRSARSGRGPGRCGARSRGGRDRRVDSDPLDAHARRSRRRPVVERERSWCEDDRDDDGGNEQGGERDTRKQCLRGSHARRVSAALASALSSGRMDDRASGAPDRRRLRTAPNASIAPRCIHA